MCQTDADQRTGVMLRAVPASVKRTGPSRNPASRASGFSRAVDPLQGEVLISVFLQLQTESDNAIFCTEQLFRLRILDHLAAYESKCANEITGERDLLLTPLSSHYSDSTSSSVDPVVGNAKFHHNASR